MKIKNSWKVRWSCYTQIGKRSCCTAIFTEKTVVHDFPHIDRVEKPGPNIPEMPGVYVAGDWAGHDEILADAAVASGKRAALHILKQYESEAVHHGNEQLYEAYQPLLFSLSYRILGSVMDAEDIVQDVFISLNNIEDPQSIENMKAYLCKMATNRSIDKLRSAAHKRNVYVGMWLPEPLVEDSDEPSKSFIMKESLSTAYLLLLQQLSEVERIVFILRGFQL